MVPPDGIRLARLKEKEKGDRFEIPSGVSPVREDERKAAFPDETLEPFPAEAAYDGIIQQAAGPIPAGHRNARKKDAMILFRTLHLAAYPVEKPAQVPDRALSVRMFHRLK
jgi:hypothetical protein